jgi:hypothetical protein
LKTLLAILALIPELIRLVKSIEKEIPVSGAGEQKLDLVLSSVQTIYDFSADLRKSIPWEDLERIVILIVDKVVALLNQLGLFAPTAKTA